MKDFGEKMGKAMTANRQIKLPDGRVFKTETVEKE